MDIDTMACGQEMFRMLCSRFSSAGGLGGWVHLELPLSPANSSLSKRLEKS